MWLFLIILGIASIVIGAQGFKRGWFVGYNPPLLKKVCIGVGAIVILIGCLLTSFVFTPTKNTGHLIKKYGNELNSNRVIAVNGERGRQSHLLQEGLSFQPFIRVLYDIEFVPYEKINEGFVGLLTSNDGGSLTDFIAPDWVGEENFNIEKDKDSALTKREYRDYIEKRMIDPKYFIENNGIKGPQLNTLKPGEWKINKYMWKVDIVPATNVPAGFVGVIESRVGKVPKNIELEGAGNKLATPVVDKGYMGIWKEVLKPGMYYLNSHPTDDNKGAYRVTLVDTRLQTWLYKGGYDYYTIDLTINEDGKISQTKSEIRPVDVPDNAVGTAIRIISLDEWDVYVDARLLVQVQPIDAPYMVASVGGLKELQINVTTPILRSELRNMGESKNATSFVTNRSDLESECDSAIKIKSVGTRLTVKEFKMNDIYIKPELLVPGKRKQLANKMAETYVQEELAYKQKILTEKASEESQQQGVLVEAKIRKQAAKEDKEAQRLIGQGNKFRMIEEALGQKAKIDVLGIENTYKLEMAKVIREYPPEAFETPYFVGSGGGNSNGSDDTYTAISIRQLMATMDNLNVPIKARTNKSKQSKPVKNKTEETPKK